METAGPNNGSTFVNDPSIGSVIWDVPGNAQTSNDIRAEAYVPSAISRYLKATGFGFSIPADAEILGIKVEVERSKSGSGNVYAYSCKLVKGGTIQGADRSTAAVFPTSDEYESMGSSADLWSLTWTADDINASNFGVAYSAQATIAGSQYARVDHIRITVYYWFPSIQVTPAPTSAVAGQGAPGVLLGSLNVTPSASAAIGGKGDPSVQVEVPVYPGAASAVGSKADPTVQLGSISVTLAASSAIAGKSDPGVVLGSLAVTPAAAAAIAGKSDPSVLLGSISVTPSPASAVGAIVDPRVSSLTWRNTWVNRGPGFIVGDLVMTQRVDFDSDANKFTVYRMLGEVRAIGKDPVTGEEYADIYISEGYDLIDLFADQVEWVVIGNKIDATRAAVIYMTADESYSPRIELRSGVDSHEKFGLMESLRYALGNLGGLVDANFGALSGFGDYTENSYRKGWTAGGSASALMTGAGYWFDKDGNARIGNPATDKYIKFNVSTGIVELGSAVALQWAAVTGSGKPADNATVGATWGSNLNNIPGYLGTTIIDLSSVASGRLVAYAGGTNQVGITAEGSGESAVRIYAGSTYADRANAPFRVTQGGDVTVTSATIKTSTGTKYIDISSGIANEMQFFEGSTSVIRIGSNINGVGTPGISIDGGYLCLTNNVAGRGISLYGTTVTKYIYLDPQGGSISMGDPNGVTGMRVTGITVQGNTVWHAGNDGTGSGLDADLWDGKHMPANAVGNLHNDGAGNLSWV